MFLSALSEVLLVVGFLLLIAGLIFRYRPPVNINRLYGYRTSRSMQSEDAWKYSQNLAARLILKVAIAMILGGVIFLFIDVSHWSPVLTVIVIFGFIVIGFGYLFYSVEKGLRNKFR